MLGSVNVDLVVRSPRLPRPGETVTGGEFYRAGGGKGANQAVATARCALAPVTFVGAVGDDPFGREMKRQLSKENLDLRFLVTLPDQATGVALILVDGNGQNMIGVAGGANGHLRPEHVEAVNAAVFDEAGVFLANLETPLETVETGLRRARQRGVTTILNPAPATSAVACREILSLVDILTPNELEARSLVGGSATSPTELLEAAQRLHELGVARVVLTRGAEGALIVDGENVSEVAAHSVDAVDATAAGDAFSGALAVALSEGKRLQSACRWANVAAALSVTRRGAQPSLPNRDAVEGFLETVE